MNEHPDFRFSSSLSGGAIDEPNGVIRGVSLMTGNLVAEGHDLEVDETTLKQVLQCAKQTGKIPVKLDHGGGITTLCGYIDGANARIDGNKVRGDWHLLKTHKEYATTMEKAKSMPECFGLSAAFKGTGEVLKSGDKKGKKAARCTRLLAVDCVTQPAANPDGLFSAKDTAVDTAHRGMPDDPNNNAEQVPAWAQKLLTSLDELRNTVAQQQDHLNRMAEGELSLEDLANMDDAAIEAAGYDVAKVRQAVEDAVASGELTTEGADPATAGVSPNAAPGSTGGAPAAPASATTAMSAQQIQQMISFEVNKVRQQARAAAEEEQAEHAFQVIEAKVDELAAQNTELTELAARQDAEIKSLRSTLKTSGVRAASPGVETTTLFSAKGAVAGSFEAIVTAEFDRLMKLSGMTEMKAKSQAIDFGVKRHAGAYHEWRARGGTIQLSAKP